MPSVGLRRAVLAFAIVGGAIGSIASNAVEARGRVVIGFGVPIFFGPPAYYYPPPPPYYAYYPPAPVYAPPPVAYAPPPVAYAPAPVAAAPQGECREYQSTVVIAGRPQPAYGTACRQQDGSWRIVR